MFAGNSASDLVNVLLAPFRELDVGRAVAERGGRLRRETGIRLPDAATAIEHRFRLVTRNVADFESIRGLRIREIA
jgi:predicted nucleic acid-binding protein